VTGIVLFAGGEAGRIAAERLAAMAPCCLSAMVWDHQTGPAPEIEGIGLVDEERAADCGDTLFCSGYGSIIGPTVLAHFGARAFNAHPSLLPAYRGRHAIQWAIAKGEAVMGVTIHRLTSAIDHGEILAQEAWEFGAETSLPQVAACLASVAATMLCDLAAALARGEEPAARQTPAALPYWRRRRASDSAVDWAAPAAAIINQVRAGGPGYWAKARRRDGSEVRFLAHKAGGAPGTVLLSTPQGCLVSTVTGVVWLVPDRPLIEGEVLGDGDATA
jgi:methionyl-tRNA formyltransferase